jgi:hypothetical protein
VLKQKTNQQWESHTFKAGGSGGNEVFYSATSLKASIREHSLVVIKTEYVIMKADLKLSLEQPNYCQIVTQNAETDHEIYLDSNATGNQITSLCGKPATAAMASHG